MKLLSLFLTVIFLFGTFVVPFSINNVYGDGVLLFTVHAVEGSAEVVTENLIKERCFVHAKIDVYSSHHGPFHRNNPDKTFYPRDAFDHQTSTWKDGCGAFWQPCPIESTPNNTVPNGDPCIKGGAKGPDNDAGTGVIDPGYAAGAVSLSKQAFAKQGSDVTVNVRNSQLTGDISETAAAFSIVVDAACPVTVPTVDVVPPGGLPLGIAVHDLTS